MLLAFNKPYGVLSQFTEEVAGQRTLALFGFPERVYPIGRLDADSEGLLLLSDEPGLNTRLLDPKHAHWRRYRVQVEGLAEDHRLRTLESGVVIQGKKTLPARARTISPDIPPRDPPIRDRKNIPTSWLEIELREGRNRQVRRMTAAVALPTLRLIRVAIGGYHLPESLEPGQWIEISPSDRSLILGH